MTNHRYGAAMRLLTLVAALTLSLVVAGCGGSAGSPAGSSPATGAPSQAPATPSSEPSAGSSSGSGALGYTTTKFGIPLTITVAPALGSAPTDDMAGLLSWTATGNDNNRVRFLVPAEVYPADTTQPVPPPKDFLAYVKGLAGQGGLFTDMKTTTVDGVPATLLTAKTTRSLDGSLGCPTQGADQAEGCFGLQPEFALRMAVMDVGGNPLIAWARTDGQSPDAAFIAAFEDMLASVDFKER
jgi:hypothetical protein